MSEMGVDTYDESVDPSIQTTGNVVKKIGQNLKDKAASMDKAASSDTPINDSAGEFWDNSDLKGNMDGARGSDGSFAGNVKDWAKNRFDKSVNDTFVKPYNMAKDHFRNAPIGKTVNFMKDPKANFQKLKDNMRDRGNRLKEGLNNFKKDPKGVLKDKGKNLLKKGHEKSLNSLKTAANGLMPASVQDIKDGAKLVRDVASGAVEPAQAAARVAARELKKFASDPKGQTAKYVACCVGCCCICPAAIIAIILIPIISIMAWLFPGLLSNDASKNNGPIAYESFIYKYANMQEEIVNKVSVDKDNTWVVSHNAKLQAEQEEKLLEHSPEMKESADYDPGPVRCYLSPSLDAEYLPDTLRFGSVVEALTGEDEDGFIAIQIESKDAGKDGQYYVDLDKTGMENPELSEVPKMTVYVESKYLYKHETPDPNMEYTVQDEFEIMARALRRMIDDKYMDSMDEANNYIAKRAEKEKGFDIYSASDSPLYDTYKAHVILDADSGKVVKDMSAVQNPNASEYDAEGSRAGLDSYSMGGERTKEVVATILSSYAVAKADSIPESGYFKTLDSVMSDALYRSLNFKNNGDVSHEATRTLITRKIQTHKRYTYTPYPYGMKELSDEEKLVISPATPRFSRVPYDEIPDNIVPNVYTSKVYGATLEDLNKRHYPTGACFKPDWKGDYVFLEDEEYRYGYSSIISNKEVNVYTMTEPYEEHFTYTLTTSDLEITPFDIESLQWKFFEREKQFYPMLKNSFGEVMNHKGDMVSFSDVEDDAKAKLDFVESMPYFQQRLSYIFDNSSLSKRDEYFSEDNKNKDLPGEPDVRYYKIVSGSTSDYSNKIKAADLPDDLDKEADDSGYSTKYHKKYAEDYSSTHSTNSANINAVRKKFLFFIPTTYKMEYRRSTQPETIKKSRIDPETGEIISDEEGTEVPEVQSQKPQPQTDSNPYGVSDDEMIQSVGMKSEYWYDNIMEFLEDEDFSNWGDGGQAVVDLAMSFMGEVGGLPFKKWYWNLNQICNRVHSEKEPHYAWCAVFVSYMMQHCGFADRNDKSGDTISTIGSFVGDFYNYHKARGEVQPGDGSYIPKAGDLIIYSRANDSMYHIGIVTAGDANGFKTVEGNTGGPGANGPPKCYSGPGTVNTHEKSYSKYYYFCTPRYPDSGGAHSVITPRLPRVLGSAYNAFDQYGRIGIGLWYGQEARELLKNIKSQDADKFNESMALNDTSQYVTAFIDGDTDRIDAKAKVIVTKILNTHTAKRLQNDMMRKRIEAIEKSINKISESHANWLDERSVASLIFMQLAFDTVGERQWIDSSGTAEIIQNVLAVKGDVRALHAAFQDMFGKLYSKEMTEFFTYGWAAFISGDEDISARDFYKEDAVGMKAQNGVRVAMNLTDKQLEKMHGGLGQGKVFKLPPGLGETKTYMGKHTLATSGTNQSKLLPYYTPEEYTGLSKINGRYVIALAEKFATVGERVDIKLSSGKVLKCILGDVKARQHVDERGVHLVDKSVMEFVVYSYKDGGYKKYYDTYWGGNTPNFTKVFPGTIEIIVNLDGQGSGE